MENIRALNTRQQAILEFINNNGNAVIKDLSLLHNVSEATVRRDLDELAAGGNIDRIRGGATKSNSTTFERYHREKMKSMLDEKRRIAAFAASLVNNGDSIFLDSGTTTFFIARNLALRTDLTIITNNLDIAYSVQFNSTTSLIVTGGLRRDNYSVLIGSVAENTIKDVYVDITFMGCDAVNPVEGIFNSNFLEVGVKQLISGCGKKTILVTDHSKFRHKALARICGLDKIDMIITDNGIDEKTLGMITKIVPNTVCV
ncbi:MAG: DeoR/GlpR family DNA-binding transcription regulator [Flexilinea sp.]